MIVSVKKTLILPYSKKKKKYIFFSEKRLDISLMDEDEHG